MVGETTAALVDIFPWLMRLGIILVKPTFSVFRFVILLKIKVSKIGVQVYHIRCARGFKVEIQAWSHKTSRRNFLHHFHFFKGQFLVYSLHNRQYPYLCILVV